MAFATTFLECEAENYGWPGNVRELAAAVRALALGLRPRLAAAARSMASTRSNGEGVLPSVSDDPPNTIAVALLEPVIEDTKQVPAGIERPQMAALPVTSAASDVASFSVSSPPAWLEPLLSQLGRPLVEALVNGKLRLTDLNHAYALHVRRLSCSDVEAARRLGVHRGTLTSYLRECSNEKEPS